jgi:hypothetical protein
VRFCLKKKNLKEERGKEREREGRERERAKRVCVSLLPNPPPPAHHHRSPFIPLLGACGSHVAILHPWPLTSSLAFHITLPPSVDVCGHPCYLMFLPDNPWPPKSRPCRLSPSVAAQVTLPTPMASHFKEQAVLIGRP